MEKSKKKVVVVKRSVVPKKQAQPLVFTPSPLDPQKEEAVYHLQALIAGMHDALEIIKGTKYYSAMLQNELDRFAQVKLGCIFKTGASEFYGDATMVMSVAFTEYLKRLYLLGQQPPEVQERFSRGMNDLFIQCGVYLPEKTIKFGV